MMLLRFPSAADFLFLPLMGAVALKLVQAVPVVGFDCLSL